MDSAAGRFPVSRRRTPEGVAGCGPSVVFSLFSPAMCRLYCPLQPPLQQAAAACIALVAAPPPRVILNGAVHPGYCSASPGRVSRHMAAMAARKDYNTQSTPGAHQSITLQHIRGGGGGGSAERCLNRKEAPSSHWGWSNWAIKSLMCLSSSGPEREEAVG